MTSTTTKEDGTYSLEFPNTGGVFTVTASYPGHKSSSKEVTVTLDSNGTLQGFADFELGLDDVYVSPTGNDTTGDGTQSKPYQTIGKGINEVNAGGRVHLADGTYQGSGSRGLTINNDVTIIGESQNGTVIDAPGADRMFNITPNANVTLQNLTLKNGTANGNSFPDNAGGAIYNSGNLTVEKCTFSDNRAGDCVACGVGGLSGAISNYGTLNITNCTFSDNHAGSGGSVWILHILGGFGGAIYNTGDLIVNNCTFSDNRAGTGCPGGAIANGDYPAGTLTVTNSTFTDNLAGNGGSGFNEGPGGDGGAIYNGGTSNIENSFFTGNRAGNGGPGYFAGPGGSGGAIGNYGYLSVERCTFYGNHAGTGVYGEINGSGRAVYNYKGTMNITGSNFENNTAQDKGGAIWNYGGDDTNRHVNFNRIGGNSPGNSEVYSENGTLDARLNWWGSNASPAGKVVGDVIYDPWLVLTVTANPAAINKGDNSTITADLLHDNNGNYHDPALGHVPDGIPITLATNWGSFNSPLINLGTVNGSVTATFHADGGPTPPDPVVITATADDQTVSTFITILGITSHGSIINIIINSNSSLLDPTQSQTQDQAQTQIQASININTNNLTNSNVNIADSAPIAINANNISNINTFNPIMILDNLNSV